MQSRGFDKLQGRLLTLPTPSLSLKLAAHRGRGQSIRWALNLTFARGTCQEATLVQERGFSERWLVT
jgi:hypothetical protein